jgi:DnaK suppressor protein
LIAMPAKKLPPPSNLSIAQLRAPAKLKKPKKEKKLTTAELKKYRQALLNLRDQVVDGISFLAGDNLNRSQRDVSGDLSGYSLHMADQGTDNYDREFALNLVSSEQDLLYEIDEAIRRIDDRKYGICEMTEEQIERARLDVVPYARCSVLAQSEMEKGRTRYRPFGPTLSQSS